MRIIAVALAAMLLTEPVLAVEPEVVRTSWSDFQQQISARRLAGRNLRITLADGNTVKTNLLEATDAALVVRATRAARQWKSTDGYARIPREQVAAVRFSGRTGTHKLIGTLAGGLAGGGIGAAVGTSMGCNEGSCMVVQPAVGAAFLITGIVAGYFVGRAMGTPAPEFVLTR